MNELKEVVIELTQRCNLSCLHCGSDCKSSVKEKELDLKSWKRIIRDLKGMKVEKIVYSGGEPTLKPGFPELLTYTIDSGFNTGFITNGFFPFSRPLLEAVRDLHPFAVGFSIDGTKNTHNYIRRNERSWNCLISNMSAVQGLGTQICVVTTINKLNLSELPKMAELFSLMGINSWQLQLATPSGRMKSRQDILISESEFQEVFQTIAGFRLSYQKMNIQAADCFGLAPVGLVRSRPWSGCSAGISSMAIDAFGNVMPCLSIQDIKYDNVLSRNIAEIWNDPNLSFLNRCFKTDGVQGLCKGCCRLADCRGGCNSQSLAYYGYPHSSPFCVYRSLTKNK